VWTGAVNPTFGTPLAVMANSGARSFQFSARVSF
jgi:hypothetical protein